MLYGVLQPWRTSRGGIPYNNGHLAAADAASTPPGERILTLKPGQTLSHYRIDRLIGQGGMGAVFLAEDLKLHRKVALKVLPEEMATNADRLARFEREAQAVAALNHPHIVTIYSVEQEGSTHFLTMELVEGDSLDRTLPPNGLPLAKVFDIGVALADALAAAHAKGIIHRDLKPANVMVTKDGRVKVLDFGLAKLMQPPTAGRPPAGAEVSSAPTRRSSRPGGALTGVGHVMGTVPYMSPEQVGGEKLDARTDIFSLGVVLYEMATGRRPFQGKNDAETISSIIRDTPPALTEARQDAPRHLARIIDHCLQKDPEARFQTAKDVRNELRELRREVESGASGIGAGSEVRSTGTVASQQQPSPSSAQQGNAPGRLRRIAAAAAVVVILAGLLVVFVGRGRNQPPPATDAARTPALPPTPATSS